MLTINLFDDTFRHATCSTGWKTPKHIQYVRDQMEWDGITLFVDGYVNSPIVDQVRSKYKIGWLHEPQCLHPENYANSLLFAHKFDFILTYYKPYLSKYLLEVEKQAYGSVLPSLDYLASKYKFTPYAGTWIPREHWGLRPKTKLVSMLYGDKRATEGHRIRHEIANAVRPLGIVDFYGLEGEAVDYSPETKLKVLGDYAFSIVTETCWQENLFTEILLDCFTVGTVPIFWGCPNVGEFFNPYGIMSFENAVQAEAIVRMIDTVGDQLCRRMLEPIYDNLNRVTAYEITEDWLYENVLRELV